MGVGSKLSGCGLFGDFGSAVAFESFLVPVADIESITDSAFDGQGNEFPECVGIAVDSSLSEFVVVEFELVVHVFGDGGLELFVDLLQVAWFMVFV